jgi:transcription antitermination protein NusB
VTHIEYRGSGLLSNNVSDLPEFNADEIIQTEVVEHDEAATERSLARRVALQALYELDCVGHLVGTVIEERLNDVTISKKAARYTRRLVIGVTNHRDQLDSLIRHYASEFPLEQVAIVDRNILRMAIYEFATQTTLSENVIIAEAIDLAKLFGAEGAARFVNGVLGALASDDQDEVRRILSPESED